MSEASERGWEGPEGIHAPWRLEYLESLGGDDPAAAGGPGDAQAKPGSGQPGGAGGEAGGGEGGFLRDYWLDPASDGPNHVIVRTPSGMILLNKFPYANGHLLVALGEGRPRLIEYEPPQRAALWKLTELAADLMEQTLRPQGINIGLNQGRAAGAGVPGHLHVHLVPRWHGDVNFMTVVGQIRVIPSSLEAMARRYREVWAKMVGQGP